MKNKKQIVRNIILFILLIVITFVIIFNNHNFEETMNTIHSVKTGYVLLAIFIMFFYFLFEGLNIRSILKSLGNKVKILQSIKYAMIGFFFSGITPAATGGQPMEIYYMKKENIPATHSTLALLIQLCSFHIITISLGIIGAIIYHDFLRNGFILVFAIGITLKTLTLITMLICLFSKKLSRKIINIFISILKMFKYKKIDKVKENVNRALEEYHEGSKYIRKHKKIFFKSLVIMFLQIISYFMVSYFIYRSFGLNEYNAIEIILIQALLFVSVSAIPLPGAVGISESGFMRIYLTLYSESQLASAMLLNRGINFYLFIFISFIVTLFTVLKYKKSTN